MKAINIILTPYVYISLLCMLISNVSYASFFDELKNQAEKSVNETTDNIKANIDKSVKDKTNTLNQKIDRSIKDAPSNVIRGTTIDSNKKKQSKENALKIPKKQEAVRVISQSDKKKKEDKNSVGKKDEDALWEAQVAEEKARLAKEKVGQAEHELYLEDLETAINKNKQAWTQARKKDSKERVSEHNHKSQDWHISHKGVEQFKKVLDAYKVEGLSFGMKVTDMEKILVHNGYKRKRRKIVHGGAIYLYSRKTNKNKSTVTIKTKDLNGYANILIINLYNAGGEGKIVEEKIRLLNTFSGTCTAYRKEHHTITCLKYKDKNELSIIVNFYRSNTNSEYHIRNVRSNYAQ